MTFKKFLTLAVIAGVVYAVGSRVVEWSNASATSTKKAAKKSSKSLGTLKKHDTPKSAKKDRDDAAATKVGTMATLALAKANRDAKKKRKFGPNR
ncbi:hypothetical protein ALI44B_11540 [Leifsonia sp. ALI-44-B]|jgi:predicted negative regulator of RcsB-dependent stress response|uniref:hypothetical protein n=1 Tax=Leifsonia sp. ALI-44-B TaxID=1933776 RepID=UPI00097C6E66|nr:hypothetical protein [Leifsonia sp. ALI-44-B]ONI61118.1 hypothetical protein ALI44B_11540 [Leifsonia sp. ALI-44-B]